MDIEYLKGHLEVNDRHGTAAREQPEKNWEMVGSLSGSRLRAIIVEQKYNKKPPSASTGPGVALAVRGGTLLCGYTETLHLLIAA